MTTSFSLRASLVGILSAFVGFSCSFAIVVQGLSAVGANEREITSSLMALSIAMGISAMLLSLRSKMPISTAWSTPGAAFLATLTPLEGGFSAAVGAFIVTAILTLFSGLWEPLNKAVSAIPTSLANAMLAGVLVPLCLAPFNAISEFPLVALPILITWLVVGRVNRLLAIPSALLVACIMLVITNTTDLSNREFVLTTPVVITPIFTVSAVIGIALPLFIITMASQNITGIAVLSSYGYKPAAGPLFSWTGLFSLIVAPFGGHGINLAAITAAICANKDAHPDPYRRYWSSIVGGGFYIVLGLLSSFAVMLINLSPPIIIMAVAGLTLMGALSSCLAASMSDESNREASLITFLVTVSGISFFGISGAFLGLLAGGTLYLWSNISSKN